MFICRHQVAKTVRAVKGLTFLVVGGKSVGKSRQVQLSTLFKLFSVPSHLLEVFNKHSELFKTYYTLMCLGGGEHSCLPLGDGRQRSSDVLM